ncbi:unnamed protein product [Nippostrongylus brasiliensis]|uniref:G_PROTEIN_RECEP_F1_2 domain-containing protein n=1 Tax=Nippostrongylus brasiliensis TaxID=27835 RepID=A0A158QXD7_NIPBR|nr:unnamed protein product [Nippostrongylus brasiliensis]
MLMGYGFLVVFLLAMFGNCINLLIYNSDQIRYYIAIRMLCTRLLPPGHSLYKSEVDVQMRDMLMNTLAMLFLLPQALRTVGAWEANSAADAVYWGYYPYQAYFVNVFGFCAISYVVVAVAGLLLALIYPLNRSVSLTVDACDRVVVHIIASDSQLMTLIERVHTIGNLLFAIVIPMSLLVFMTISVVWKLVLRKSEFPSSSHFTSEKRCVTRITLITTSLQLLAELPPIPVFILAAISGPRVINEIPVCVWNTVGVFLGLCNMSLSFFVYITLSQKFRQMVYNRLREVISRFLPCCGTVSTKTGYQTEPYTQRTFLSAKGTEYLTETYLMADRSLSVNEDTFL